MPLWGFAQTSDMNAQKKRFEALRTRVDDLVKSNASTASRVDDLAKSNVSTASRLDDLAKSNVSTASRVDDLADITEDLQNCTPLMQGVHLCRKPMYDKLESWRTVTPKSLIYGTEDVCIKVENLSDLAILQVDRFGPGHKVATRDLPNNYLCVSKGTTKQYLDPFFPEAFFKYVEEKGDVPHTEFPKPVCDRDCSKYTCDEFSTKRREEVERQYARSKTRVQVDHWYDPKTRCAMCVDPKYKCRPYA